MTITPVQEKLAFIGAGNMAGALIKGLLGAGASTPDRIWATDVRPQRLSELADQYGIHTGTDNAQAARWADVVVLAVKPQLLGQVLPELSSALHNEALVVSVAAGVPTSVFEAHLASGSRVVRVMPNTPALVDAGATAITAGSRATAEDTQLTSRLFSSVGTTAVVDEALIDGVTGVSGSGPAYVFIFIEALADAGVETGLPRDVSQRLAAQTVFGAAKLVLEGEEHPAQLKDRVTSPGGTTIQAVHTLESRGLRAAVLDAVQGAARRARELGEQTARKLGGR